MLQRPSLLRSLLACLLLSLLACLLLSLLACSLGLSLNRKRYRARYRAFAYTNPPGVSLNRLELKKHMRYFFCAKIFCVLQKKLGKIFSSSGREWPTIHEPNNLQMAPHRYRGRTTHRGTQNRRRVRVGFDFEPPRVAKLAIFTFCVEHAGVFRIVAGDRTPSGSGSCRRGRGRGVHSCCNGQACSAASLRACSSASLRACSSASLRAR